MIKKYTLSLIAFFCVCIAFGQQRELVILHTNDTHSQIEPLTTMTDYNVGGFLRREAVIRSVREEHPDVLLLDAGDFSQGTPYYNFFKGRTEVKLMNAMGYDVCTLGNHEFDYGTKSLARLLKKAKFTIVCSNYDFKNKSLQKSVKKNVVLEKNGLKIGIFGLLTDVHSIVSQKMDEEALYLDPVRTAQNEVEELKSVGCQLIICLSHLGVDENTINDYTIAESVSGIDIIIGGHSHKEFQQPVVIGNTRIYQMAKSGKGIGKITLQY